MDDKFAEFLKAKAKKPTPAKSGDESVARVVDDELAKLGWADNARLSFMGDLGRENAWNRKTIFGGHKDPKNKAFNRGIISWQGDRREKLDNFLKGQGVLGRNDDEELRAMVRFVDEEMKSSPEWRGTHSLVRDPGATTAAVSEGLRKYIKYVPDGPYNSPDPNFRVKNNAQWAGKASKIGIGQDKFAGFIAGGKAPVVAAQPAPPPIGGDKFAEFLAKTATPTVPKPVAPINVDQAFQPQTPTDVGIPTHQPPVQTLGGSETVPVNTPGTAARAVTPGLHPRQPTPPAQVPQAPAPQQPFANAPPAGEVTAAYQQFLKDTGLPDSLASIQEFNTVQKSLYDAQKPATDQYNQEVAEYNASLRQQPQAQRPAASVQPGQKQPAVSSSRKVRTVGPQSDDLNTEATRYTPPEGVTDHEQIVRGALRSTGQLTGQEIEDYLSDKRRNGQPFLDKSYADYVKRTGKREIVIPWATIAKAKGIQEQKTRPDDVLNQAMSDVTGQAQAEGAKRFEEVQSRVNVDTGPSRGKPYSLPETAAEMALEKRMQDPGYSASAKASRTLTNVINDPLTYLMNPWGPAMAAGQLQKPLDPAEEKQRLLKQHGSYSKAWDAEQEYQNEPGVVTAARMINQTARSFATNLVSGTAKSIAFLDKMNEDLNPLMMAMPEQARPTVRNAVNTADFLVRLISAPDAATAYREWDRNTDKDDIDKTTLFKAATEFDKAIGEDPVLKGRFFGGLSNAAGSAFAFIALGATMPSLRLAKAGRDWSSAVSGALQMAGPGYQDAEGLSERDRKIYGTFTGLLGMTEMLGAGNELAALIKNPGIRGKLATGFLEAAKVVTREGKQEFWQELGQTASGKAALEYLRDNEPDTYQKVKNLVSRLPKQIADAASEEAIYGLITGGALGGATHIANRILSGKTEDTADDVSTIPDSVDTTSESVDTVKVFTPTHTTVKGEPIKLAKTEKGYTVTFEDGMTGDITSLEGLTPLNEKKTEIPSQPASVDAKPLVQDQPAAVTPSVPVEEKTAAASIETAENTNSVEIAQEKEPAAEAKPPREFSSTQVDMPPKVAQTVKAIGDKLIADEDVDPVEGREDKPHITVKFGLHTNDVEEVREILANEKPFKAKLGKTSIFDSNEEFDVVKVDVESPELHRLNELIADNTETTDTHPEYKPHLTLAYVKKGEGKKYVGRTDLEGTEIEFDAITFSSKDREKIAIPLGGKEQSSAPVSGGERKPAATVRLAAEPKKVDRGPIVARGLDLTDRAAKSQPAINSQPDVTDSDYVTQAVENLKKTSRTAQGIVDTSASPGKAGKMTGVSGDEAATRSVENVERAIRLVEKFAKEPTQNTPARLGTIAREIARQVNRGILKDDAPLERTEDSSKFPYTRIERLPEAVAQFNEELAKRLADPKADPIETAAWIEWRANLTDHFWSDGVGKASKLLAAFPLIRAGLPLPKYRDNKEMFALSPKAPIEPKGKSGQAYLGQDWLKFLDYYRSLFDAPADAKTAGLPLEMETDGKTRKLTINYDGLAGTVWLQNLPEEGDKRQLEYLQRVYDDPGKFVDEYISHFPKVVNPDEAKLLFPEYRLDPLGTVATVHTASSLVSRLVWAKHMRDLPKGSEILFMAGGAASGKSTNAGRMMDHADLIVDTTMSDKRGNEQMLNEVRDKGHNPIVVLVWREPREAARFMLDRYLKEFRVIPINIFAKGHFDAAKAMIDHTWEYANKAQGFPTDYRSRMQKEHPGTVTLFAAITDKGPEQIAVEELASLAYDDFGDLLTAVRNEILGHYERNKDQYGDERILDVLEGRSAEYKPASSERVSLPARPDSRRTKGGDQRGTAEVDTGVRAGNEGSRSDAQPQVAPAKTPSTSDRFKKSLAKLRDKQAKPADTFVSDISEIMGFTTTLKHAAEVEHPFYASKYEKLEPVFATALASFEAATPDEQMDLFLEKLSASFTPDQIAQLEPYVVKFIDANSLTETPEESIEEVENDTGTATVDEPGEDVGEDGAISSGPESDGVLGEELPDVPKEPGTGSEEPGADQAGPVLSDVQPDDRRGDRPADSETGIGEGSDLPADGGERSDVDGEPATATKPGRKRKPNPGDVKRVIGTTGNFYVNDVEAFAAGGLKAKFRRNIEAIDTLRKIQAEGRTTATPEEQSKLAAYIGWGQFPALFNVYNDKQNEWAKEREELMGFISKEEFESASASTKNAHYTAPQVVRTVWDIVQKLGFKGGNVVETSMGVGNFFYLMPKDLRGTTRATGIELDLLTAQIAKLLFPKYDIRQMGYQEFAPPKGFYDLAISNVPFGRYAVDDRNMPHFLKERIHNYFFAKSLDNVRPGGLIAFITSTGTMDKSIDVLKHLQGKADLVASMRFPANTFLKEAGTAVVTDLVILRVKNPNLARELKADVELYETALRDDEKSIADYQAEIKALEKKSPEYSTAQIRLANVQLHAADVQKKLDKAKEGLAEAERFARINWTETATIPDPDGGEAIEINRYYVDNPKMLLGRVDRTGTMYGGKSVNLSRTPDFEVKLQAAIDSLPKGILLDRASELTKPAELEAAPESMRQGSLTVKDGKVFTREGSYLVERAMTQKNAANVAQVLKVRDALNETVDAERKGDLKAAEAARKTLNAEYDAYVKDHGTIHDNRKLLEIDPDHFRLLALENFDKKTRKVTGKADVFSTATVSTLQRADTAASYTDAINIVLNQRGFVDVPEIARLMGTTIEGAEAELTKEALAFNDPRDGWMVKDLYLSGEVRRKLREAREAAALDEKYQGNVEALEKVQPEDLPYRKITPTLGAAWIPPSDIKQFMADMMSEAGQSATPKDFHVTRLATGDWIVSFANDGLRTSSVSKGVLGTEERNFADIILAAIKDMPIVIKRSEGYGEDRKTFTDKKATARANRKVRDIKAKFKKWIWQDDARRERLHRAFNDTYNDTTKTKWDGSHLTFPGMNPVWIPKLYSHIKHAVYRLITQGRLLAAHEVGTGKTNIMIASAMELRRLGLAKKPAIVCLNSNVEQVAESARELYPSARVLAAFQGMDAKTRQETTTRIMSGDWDIVVLTHENLVAMPMSKERQVAFIREELQVLRDQVAAAEAMGGEDSDTPSWGRQKKRKNEDNRVVKALEAKIANREAKLKELFDTPKDEAITFEETGIDFLMVDEAHAFKNLDIYTTRVGTKGIPTSDAKRATNLFLVTRYLAEMHNNRGVAFFTGTPISNTTAEAFNMMRYLMWGDLKARGIELFDSWAANYGENIQTQEMTATGDYKAVTAFRKFKNLDTLSSLLGSVMDVVFADDVADIVRPARKDRIVTTPMSDEQKNYQLVLQARAEALKTMSRDERMQKGADNWLALGTDAKKAAMDMRLVDADAADDPNSKTNKLVGEVLRISKENPGKVQLIFSDIGINGTVANPRFSLYQDIINKLVAGGIPRNKIIDFSKFKSGKAKTAEDDDGESPGKEAAMRRLNEGDALIAIGGSQKLGTGVNVQKKVVAMHKLDVKQRPDQDEQETGRGWRGGNEHKEVELIRYTTQDSFDMFFYDRLKQKKSFIDALLRGELTGEFEDSIDESLDYDTVVAVTASNPLIRERIDVMRDLRQLEEDYEGFEENRLRLKDRKARILNSIKYNEGVIADLASNREEALKHVDSNTIEIEGEKFEIEDPADIRARGREITKIKKDVAEAMEIGEKGPTDEQKEQYEAEVDFRTKQLEPLQAEKAVTAMQNALRKIRGKLKNNAADYKFRSDVLFRHDGRYDFGYLYGLPLFGKFEQVKDQPDVNWALFVEFPETNFPVGLLSLPSDGRDRIASAIDTSLSDQKQKQVDRDKEEIPRIDKGLEEKFEEFEKMEELRRKLTRIEIELGADTYPEGYVSVESRMTELADPAQLAEARKDSREFVFGQVGDAGPFYASDVVTIFDTPPEYVTKPYSGSQLDNVSNLYRKASEFVRKVAKNKDAHITPFAVDTEQDVVIFNNGQAVHAEDLAPLVAAHPDVDYTVDRRMIYAFENGRVVGILTDFKYSEGIGEDLQPAMKRAQYARIFAKERKIKPYQGIIKALEAAKVELAAKAEPGPAGSMPLKSVAGEGDTEQAKMTWAEMQDLPYAPIDELLTGTDFNRTGDRIRLNAKSHELFRRTREEAEIRRGKIKRGSNDFEDMFKGQFFDPLAVKETVDILREKADEARKLGYTLDEVAVFTRHADALELAAQAGGGTANLFVFDQALPEEVFHQADYLGAADKNILNRHADEQKKRLDAHPIKQILWDKHFARFNTYRRFTPRGKDAVLRAEIPPYLLELTDSQLAELGITPEQRDDYLLTWFEGYAAKNGVDALDNFEKEELDVQNYIERVKETQGQQDGQPSQKDEADPGEQPRPSGETRAGPPSGSGRSERTRDGLEKGQEWASLPDTLRRAGIETEDLAYDVFGDAAAFEEAKKLIDENGIDGTLRLLDNVGQLDVHHAMASFMIQKMLLNRAAELESTNQEEAANLRAQAREAGRKHVLNSIAAGRFTRAASVIPTSVEGVLFAFQGVVEDVKQDLSAEKWAEIEALGRELEEKDVKLQAVIKERSSLKRKVKRLEDEKEGRKAARRTQTSDRRRKALVALVKKDKTANVDALREKLRAKFGGPSALASVAGEGSTLKSVAGDGSLSDQDLSELAEVGALMLMEGIEQDTYLPEHFEAEMLAEFGDAIRPYFQEIYKRSWERRDEWLREIRKDSAADQIRRKFGEWLTDEEVEEILGERKQQAARRRAIENIHKFSSTGQTRRADLDDYARIIAEMDISDNAAAAAMLFAEGVSFDKIKKTLNDADITGVDEREALRDGRDAYSEAKKLRAIEKDAVANEILETQKEIKEISDLRWAARNELKKTLQKISDEMQRIKKGEYAYRKGQVVEISHIPRTMMASGDLSGALRQGGFFAISEPESQKQAFVGMFKSITDKGYGRTIMEIEDMPLFTLFQRMGVDFAMAGQNEKNYDLMGEELFRGEEYIEKVPILGKLIAEGLIKPSERTYTAFLDVQRAVMANVFVQQLMDDGLTFAKNPEEFKKIGDFINIATGRGTIPTARFAKILMNLPLFAPRYTLSRLQLLNMTLNPVAYARMPVHARKIVAKKAVRFYGTTMGALGLVSLFGGLIGASVNWDDDDSEFLKIKIGHTHYDLFAGTLQPAKVIIKLAHSAIRTKAGFDNRVAGEMIWDSIEALGRFARGKLSPVASLAVDAGMGTDYVGNKTELLTEAGGVPLPGKAIYSRFIPLTLGDMKEAYKLDGLVGIAKSTPFSVFGVGVSSYKRHGERPETEAEKLAAKMAGWNFRGNSKLEKEQREMVADLTQRSRQGEKVDAEVNAAMQSGTFTPYHKKNILDASKKTLLIDKAEGLTIEDVAILMRVANAGEKEQLMKLLRKKAENAASRGELRESQKSALQRFGIRPPAPKPKKKKKPALQ